MLASVFILLTITSSSMVVSGRPLTNPDELSPLFLSSSLNNNQMPTTSHSSPNHQNRLLGVVDQIIKYVSTIKSNEKFIDNIISRQKQVVDKLKILQFLRNCFQITNTFIQREIYRASNALNTNKGSFISLTVTLEELQEVQSKIHNLLQVIQGRMALLNTWIPPTMPFLSF